ncbi:TolC family protein [candidate division KSB1 bacterium]|nr:TolC family protein [candidate division KSB1 bacterium]
MVNSTAPLSVDSLVQIGFRNNPGLHETEQDIRLNAIGKVNAAGQFLPTASVGANFSESHYSTATFTNPDGSVSAEGRTGSSRSSSQDLSASWLLFDGAQRYYLYKMAKSQETINNLTVGDARKTLARTIASQAVLVLTRQKLHELSQKLRDQRQDAYDLAKARFDVGAVTELDVLQAQIALGRAENDITSAARDLQSAREQLNQTLGIDLKSDYAIEEFGDATPFQFELDNLIHSAYVNRTDLEIARLSSKVARYNLLRTKQNYLPTASLGATWSRSQQVDGTSDAWTLDPKNRYATYSLRLSWTLFDGFSRELDVVQQRVNRDKAEDRARQLELSLERDVRDAFYALENAYNQLQITGRNRELASRTLELERERYRLGATSQLSLRDAQVTYAQAETDHLSKQLEYQSNLIALELAVGMELR